MASNLCCTAEYEARPDSPELPNARPGLATPAKGPHLPHHLPSPISNLTSGRSEGPHKLHESFNNAHTYPEDNTSPAQATNARFGRGSMYSLRSLHKMTSMRSILKRKLPKDPSNKDPAMLLIRSKAKSKANSVESSTVIKQPREGPSRLFNITKNDLQKDLLSDKKPDEGGYDPDAEILDDIARKIGKKSPGKRPSIHRIEWTPSTSR